MKMLQFRKEKIMRLSDVLRALSYNTNVSVTLVDKDENTLVTFGATGYESIESDLQTHEVVKIKIVGSKEVTLILGDII